MKKLVLFVGLLGVTMAACGSDKNPNRPTDPGAGGGGPWGCYVEATNLVVNKFKTFDLAMAGCIEEKIKTGGEYYVKGPGNEIHPVEVPPQDLTINPVTFPTGTVNETYPATTLQATGGEGPYDWEIASGSLPPGLVLTVDGTVQGTPLTAVGSPFEFRVAVTDINQVTVTETFTITILGPTPTITTTTLPDATEGTTYTASVQATGGVAPLSFRLSSGSLPAGLSLSSTGTISGTVGLVSSTTTSTFVVEVEDDAGRTSTQSLSITVLAEPDVEITTISLPVGDAGVPYSVQFSSTGGVGTIQWSLIGGLLPSGITFSGTGLMSGITSASGDFPFTVEARDSIGQTATVNLTLSIRATAPVITTTSLPSGQVGTSYAGTISWSGGQSPYQVTISGGLPPGLSSNGSGLISGVPTTRGEYTFTVVVTDANNKTDQQPLTIVIDSPPLAITTSSLPAGRVNDPYSATLAGTGGETPYQWSMYGGSLPPGLSLSSDGVISGTPTSDVGTPYLFQVQLSSADNQTQVTNFSIAVDGMALSALVPGVLPVGMVNSPYTYQLNAQGGTTPYTWAITSGSLPPGLSLSSGGTISGTPTNNNEPQYVFTVRVTDADGNTDSMQTSMIVEDSDAIVPDATVKWTPPTARVDGTPLDITELGGYRVFARPQGNEEWVHILDITNAYQNWAEFYNLTVGVWEFAATAYDTNNLESELSVIVSKEITVE